MSVQELENRVRELPPEDLRRFAEWWESFRDAAFVRPLLGDAAESPGESEEVRQELLRRRQEYREHPERFLHLPDAEGLDRFFKEIRREVTDRVSSARQV